MESLQSRFDAKFERGDINDCWEWAACRNPKGYGMFRNPPEQLAHRTAYLLAYGDIPAEMCVCHRCDNPPCVNPSHLFLGTQNDNTQDKMVKDRYVGPTFTRATHPMTRFTDENVAEMCTRYIAGETQDSIAASFDTSQQTVSGLVRETGLDGLYRRARGVRSANGKLTDDDVREIRRRNAAGVSQCRLAREYGVSQQSIYSIVHRRTFKYL